MAEELLYLPIDQLRSFIRDVFQAVGVPDADADFCADVLIASDAKGIESHGIGRLRYYYERIKKGQHQVITKAEVVRETPTTAVIDGHHGMGMIVARKAMQMAIDKAHAYGMGSVAVRNSTHFGIAGYYSLMAANQGCIGMTFTNARPSVSPTFGVQAMLGTNPISFAAPTDEEYPFSYDGATPIIQRGKIEVAARAQKPVASGLVIDDQSQYIVDSAVALAALGQRKASFLPLGGAGEGTGGHKGYGLGTMVEILSASLQSGKFLLALTGVAPDGSPQPFYVGHFFMAINIESFTSLDDFKATTGQILRELRNSEKAPGQPRIYVAGEKEFENEKITRARGVPVNANLLQDLLFLKQELSLNQYDFGS